MKFGAIPKLDSSKCYMPDVIDYNYIRKEMTESKRQLKNDIDTAIKTAAYSHQCSTVFSISSKHPLFYEIIHEYKQRKFQVHADSRSITINWE